VDTSRPHWSQVPFSSSSAISPDLLPRAGHSAVVLNSTHLVVYSGYRFTAGRSNPFTTNISEGEGRQGVVSSWADGELLSYDLRSNQWVELNTTALPPMLEEEEGKEVTNGQTSSTEAYSESGMWNVTSDNSTSDEDRPVFPSPRYGHTAVLYNVSWCGTSL